MDKQCAEPGLESLGRRAAEAAVKKLAYEADPAGFVDRARTARAGPLPGPIVRDILSNSTGRRWWRRLFAHPGHTCVRHNQNKEQPGRSHEVLHDGRGDQPHYTGRAGP